MAPVLPNVETFRAGEEPVAGSATAVVVVDEEDPFFFDHPLDHVPAMLLIDSCLRTAALTESCRMRIGRAEFRFHRYCEKDVPATVAVAAASDIDLRDVRVMQNHVPVCEGRLHSIVGQEPWWAPLVGERADRALVHKRSVEAVLVGPLREIDVGYAIPVVDSPLRGEWARLHPLSPMIEATRQAAHLVGYRVAGIPTGTQFVIDSLSLDMELGPGGCSPTELRCRDWDATGRRYRLPFSVLTGDRILGRISLTGRLMSLAAYLRLRKRG